MSIEQFVTTKTEQSTQTFEWGEITWLDGDGLTEGVGLTVGEVTIYPGAQNAEHFHPNCEESLYLLSGELEHTIGDEVVTLTSGDLIHIPRGETHQAVNPSDEDAVAVIAYDTENRQVEVVGGGTE